MNTAVVLSQPAQHLADCLAGVDEAGRGPLAGPVVAAAVVLAPRQVVPGVTDSKLLSPGRRARLAVEIRDQALAFAIGRAEVEEIDRLNILQASLLAMMRALAALGSLPGRLRVDGRQLPSLTGYTGQAEALVGGDRKCPAIGAASILAKVTRDAEMERLDRAYPGYGFGQHKGYPTAAHREALLALGPCAAHRRSYHPVRESLERRRQS
jgi:ribonuclease HII